MKMLRIIYDWMGEKTTSAYAQWWLATLFFLESFCFPIPVDPLLILFCIQNRKRSLYYALLATGASVLGGITGYCIGACLWETIGTFLVGKIISPFAFEKARALYAEYQNLAVFIAGFSPLPYKAVTLSAGFCRLSFLPFIIYSIIGRGARFFLLSGTIYLWGEQIKVFIDRFFNQLVLLFSLLIIIGIWFIFP